MNTDGTNQTVLTPITLLNSGSSLSWSPDGSKIAFEANGEIFTINVDGSNRINLTNHPALDGEPSWSPDGSRILFTSERVPYSVMYTMNADGSDLRMLSTVGDCNINECYDVSPDWSPTGDKIVFVVFSDDFHSIIYTANADGTNRRPFDGTGLGGTGDRYSPKWSPDGTKIVFHFFINNDIEIYVKNVNGGGLIQLTNTNGRNYQPSWQPIVSAPTFADFDGDGKADISVFRPSDRIWYLNRSSQGFSATQFGLSTDKITPADFDGDGKTDIAVFRDGFWYWLNSSNNAFNAAHFGQIGDIPVPADFTGDGRAEIAVFRGGNWYSLDLSNNQVKGLKFGIFSDKPVAADYDGDGKADIAVVRQETGLSGWYILGSANGFYSFQFGADTDKLVPADYDGDGKTDIAVYRNGIWYLQQSTNGFTAFQWGNATDIPAPADYDGEGKTDFAIYRSGTWFILHSSNGQFTTRQFGASGDIPIAGVNVQ